MTQLHETIGGETNGGIPYIEASFPVWMDYGELDEAYKAVEPEVIGDKEPPVVSAFYPISAAAIEDYRRFIVEFSNHATVEDVLETVRSVSFAILKYRKQSDPESSSGTR